LQVVEPKKAVLREAEAALVAAAEKLAAKQAQLAEVEAQVGGASCFSGGGLLHIGSEKISSLRSASRVKLLLVAEGLYVCMRGCALMTMSLGRWSFSFALLWCTTWRLLSVRDVSVAGDFLSKVT
jgi:hypothetical protein